MPIDLFEAHGVSQQSDQPVDLLAAQMSGNDMPQKRGWDPGFGGLIRDLANSPGTNAVLGFGDALRNMVAKTASMIPGVNIPDVKSANGTAYDIGKIGGELAGFVGGGEAIDALRAAQAAKNAGLLSKGAQFLGENPVLKRILGSAGFGAIENPEDRLKGAALGGVLGAGAEALPGALGIFTKPRVTAKGIQDFIAGKKKSSSELYQNIIDKAGSEPILNINEPFGNRYSAMDKDILSLNKDLENVHKDFMLKPTVENAHNLQRQLGFTIGKYAKKDLSFADEQKLNSLRNARADIRADLISHLENKNPELAADYQKATDIFRDYVAPFKKIKETNPVELRNQLNRLQKKYTANDMNLPPEISQQLSNLKNSLYARNLGLLGTAGGLGALGMGVGGHIISPVETLGALVGGKFLGGRSPEALNNIAQKIFMGLQRGGSGLGTLGKATIPGAIQ